MNEHAKPAVQPRNDVYRDDEVYFHHPKGPLSGKVLAHGQHGCTVERNGKRHKVRWEHVLGHKKRSEVKMQMLEQGEDGMVIQDAFGKRRYLGVQSDEAAERVMIRDVLPREPEPIAKAAPVDAVPLVPVVEAQPIKNELRKSDHEVRIVLLSQRKP